MFKSSLLLSAGLLASISAQASNISFDLSNDTVDLNVVRTLSEDTQVFADFGYHEDNGRRGELGVRALKRVGVQQLGFGVKMMSLWAEKRDDAYVGSLGVDYALLVSPLVRFNASAYYAPSVLTSNDVDSFYDFDAKFSFRMMPNLDLHAGYKLTRFKYDNNVEFDFNDEAYLGALYRF